VERGRWWLEGGGCFYALVAIAVLGAGREDEVPGGQLAVEDALVENGVLGNEVLQARDVL
jgi:hypothetical protein